MDVTVALDSEGGITITATNMHPIEQADASRLIADLVLRLHHELTHCGDDGAA